MSELTKKDILGLKERISYNPITGQFFRKTAPDIPMKLYNRDRASYLLKSTKNGHTKWHQAWRVAIYLAQGTYPLYEDSICYKDGDNANFKITNLEVIKVNENEITTREFAKKYGLSINTVKKKLHGLPYISRVINRRVTYFYNTEAAFEICNYLIEKKMQNDNVVSIDELIEIQKIVYIDKDRKNNLIRDFLATWCVAPPTRWSLTL